MFCFFLCEAAPLIVLNEICIPVVILEMPKKSIVFFGSDPIALPLLDFVLSLDCWVLRAVFTQPDRQKGRGRKIRENEIKAWAKRQKVPVYQPEKLTDQTEQWFLSEGIDLALVMAYSHMLEKTLLAIPPLGFWNFHTSLLPRLRGAAPIAGAIAEGLSQTGVTLMKIIPKRNLALVLG